MPSCRVMSGVAVKLARASGIPRRRLAAALTVMVFAVISIAVGNTAALAAVKAVSPQKAVMAELMKSFHPRTGLIGTSWWQAAVALSTVETYQQATGDKTYSYALSVFGHHTQGKFETAFNDDTGWWALAWVQAYHLTGSRKYLVMAEAEADYMHRSWDGVCGGGLYWTSAKTYKNAIANEVFLELTAWLHNSIPGDKKYLGWAKAEWSWFEHSGMINSVGLVNDGLNSRCANNQDTTWTYNQGVILAGLAQLYRATKQASLLSTAERIARAAIRHLTSHGVLKEPCRQAACGNSNGAPTSFKGIFVQDLKVLAVTAKTSQFSAFFTQQAHAIEVRDTNRQHQFGLLWAGPLTDLTPYTQASAEAALLAALN